MIGSRFQIDINEANPELNAPLIRSPGLTFESKYGELQSTNHLVLTFFFFFGKGMDDPFSWFNSNYRNLLDIIPRR